MLFIIILLIFGFIISLSSYIVIISPFILLKPFKKTINYFIKKNIITDPNVFGIRYKIINFSTFDNINLIGCFLEAANPKATIIFLHGIGDSRFSHLEFMSNFVRHGYNVLMYDARAHGESAGNFCTFGFYEKNDVGSAINFLDENKLIQKNEVIGLMGVSLGGAVALQSLYQDSRIKFCIIESAFSNFRSILKDYRSTGIFRITKLFNKIIDNRIEKLAKFSIDDITPERFLKGYSGKVLLVHGEKDRKILVKYHVELKKNARNCESIIIPGADHNDVRELGGEDYVKKLLNFADKAIFRT